MAEMDFEKLLSGEGIAQDAVPEGIYTFKVLDARAHEGKGNGTVFADLEVQGGPLAGSITQVSIYIPDGSGKNPRGSAFMFAKKVAGFDLGPEVGRAMNGGKPAPILAEAIVDQVVIGEVDVQTEGQYAGANNLLLTKPADEAVEDEEAEVKTTRRAARKAKAAAEEVAPDAEVESVEVETTEAEEPLPF